MTGRTQVGKGGGTGQGIPDSLEFGKRGQGEVVHRDIRFGQAHYKSGQGIHILLFQLNLQHLRSGTHHFRIFKMLFQPVRNRLLSGNILKTVLMPGLFTLPGQVGTQNATHITGLMTAQATFAGK